MADAVILKRGGMKIVAFAVVLALGYYFLWPEHPPMDWMKEQGDLLVKFAFIAWLVVAAGMLYDALVQLAKGVLAVPEKTPRRR
jgi:hypothetical protein